MTEQSTPPLVAPVDAVVIAQMASTLLAGSLVNPSTPVSRLEYVTAHGLHLAVVDTARSMLEYAREQGADGSTR